MTLTPREQTVLDHIALAMTNKEIANALHLSHRTVETHRLRIMRKYNARNGMDLMRKILLAGSAK